MYITPEEFATKFGLPNTPSDLREYEDLIKVAMDRVDQYVGCPRENLFADKTCGYPCTDGSCFPNTFPRSIDICPTDYIGELLDADTLPTGSIADYWLYNGTSGTFNGLTINNGQYIVLNNTTNYPQVSDYIVLDEIDSFVCIIPFQVKEATAQLANSFLTTGTTTSSDCCDGIKTISIGSITVTKQDSGSDTTSNSTLSDLLSGFVCRGYKMP